MKRIRNVILSALFLLAGIAAHAQILQPDSLNNKTSKPQIRIKVKKVYDKNGNIVRYDSTYTWTYNSQNGEKSIRVDSLMSHFIPFFRENLPGSLSEVFGNPNIDLNDSAMMMNFFNNDHFFDQWQRKVFDVNREMRALDSLRMEFLKKYLHEPRHRQKRPKAGIY